MSHTVNPILAASNEPATLTLSTSEIGTLRRCPRRYRIEYVEGRRGPGGVEADWGAAFHRGLEVWLGGQGWHGDSEIALSAALEAALSSGVDEHGRAYQAPADPYARAALRAMLRAYAAVWGPSDALRYEVLVVELPFNLPILTRTGRESRGRVEGARREGKIDAIVRGLHMRCAACGQTTGTPDVHEPSPCCGATLTPGGVWVVEHKSTGKPPAEERFYVGLEIDRQTATYFDAASILGYPVAGVLYDVIRRPDFDEMKPAPALTKSGEPRKARTRACEACSGDGVLMLPCEACGGVACACEVERARVTIDCPTCSGSGRVAAEVAYSNPRHGESAAAYEERVYSLATSRPADYFARRELPIADWQIEEARAAFRDAALEVRWRARAGAYPMVGDRYVCAARGMVCPWLDECGRVESKKEA